MLTTIAELLKAKSTAVQTVRSTETLTEAVGQMAELNIGALPVVDGGQLVGILSERDVLKRVVKHRLDPDATQVAQVMSSKPTTIRPETRVFDALQLMSEQRFRHLPILEAGRLIGMVSMGDLTARVIADQNDSMNRMIGAVKAMRPVG